MTPDDGSMATRPTMDAQEALICTMVLMAATGGDITDREIGVMSGLVQTLPVFRTFSSERLAIATDTAISLLRNENGLAQAGRLVREALEPRLRETAYVLACEVAAADRFAEQDALRMLEFVRNELHVDPLVAAAIERGARARHQLA